MVSEMNHVQALKNQFERLSVADGAEQSRESQAFRRSATLMDFSEFQLSGEKAQFQRQDCNSKSVRRRGAFRLEKKPDVLKSPAKRCEEVKEEELQYLATSETIKQALKQPLPVGSPPKKPPRTFAATPLSSPVVEVKDIVPKSSKIADGMKLLNCIIAPCTVEPIYYEQITGNSHDDDDDEQIYMEPTLHRPIDVVTKKQQPQELHYMCTNLIDLQSPQSHTTNEHSSLDSGGHCDATVANSFSKVRMTMISVDIGFWGVESGLT
jgi:hypothetical protein